MGSDKKVNIMCGDWRLDSGAPLAIDTVEIVKGDARCLGGNKGDYIELY